MDLKNRAFLVTGGTSLIGSHLADALRDAGAAEIRLLDNFSLSDPAIVGTLERKDRVRVIKGDITRPAELLEAMKGVDGVFAMAAYLTLPLAADPAKGVEVNVMGTVNTLEAARQLGGVKVVQASSISVYGDQRAGVVDEARPFGSHGLDPAFSTYAATKLVAEHLGRLYSRKYDAPVCAARFSTVYGENQHGRGVNALYILEAMQAVARGEAPTIQGDGEDAHDFIHAADVARGCLAIMAKGTPGGSYNIASGVSTKVKDAVRLVLAEYGSDHDPVLVANSRAARAAAHGSLNIAIGKAASELGWVPSVSLAEGIHRLRVWLEQGRASA